jgi:spermidine/putrescine-binding protein
MDTAFLKEEGIPEETIEALRAMGIAVRGGANPMDTVAKHGYSSLQEMVRDFMENRTPKEFTKEFMAEKEKSFMQNMELDEKTLSVSAARDLLIKQKQNGIVKAYEVDQTKEKMVLGEAALALMWSGDAMYSIDRNPDLRFVVPSEGSNIWVDPMVISSTARNVENAHLLIDFLTRPEIAKMNCDYIRYSSPNLGAIALMGEEYTQNEVLNPSDDIINRCEFFHDVGDFINVYNTLWGQIKGS